MREIKVTTARSITSTRVESQAMPIAPAEYSKLGAKGARVSQLQTCLKEIGLYKGKISGTFDKATEAALKEFQTKKGLPVSGKYGPKTRDALLLTLQKDAETGGPRLRTGLRGAAVRKLEKALVAQGLLAKADDTFDAATAAAVKKFEKKNGLKVDGIVGEAEWKKLGHAGAGSGPALRKGSSGDTVKALQRELKKLGLFDGAVDGKFGASTERAVKALERRNSLTVDGKADARVWGLLRTHVVTEQLVGGPTLKAGFAGGAVKILQRKLKAEGLYAGPIDGKFGATTKAAVQKFERRVGAKADGVVGNALWTTLGGAGVGSGPKLKQGSSGDAVKVLQRSLKAKGVYSGPIDGEFGAQTKKALQKLEKREGLKADGVAGNEVWRAVGKHVVLGKELDAGEPKHDYRRVSFRGAIVNVRTKIMIERVEAYAKKMGVPVPVIIVQGSYSSSVSASGGTHDGGGALDIRTRHLSLENVKKLVKAFRMAGFAAWKRGYGGDSFDPHIHAIAIGDR